MRSAVSRSRWFLALLVVGCGTAVDDTDPERGVAAPELAPHAFRATPRGLEARSVEQGFALVAGPHGLTITHETRELALRTTRIGRAGHVAALGAPAVHAEGARVEMAHEGIVEWFENGPRGVEHGVDLAERPAGEGVIELEVEVEGALHPVLVGTAIELQDAEGTPRARYADLVVRDAAERRLPAQVAVRGGAIVLRVDDTGARYPVVVDPLITADVAELTASDAAAGDEFGGTPFETSGGPSVAVSGTTAAVAAPWNDGGAVYVYVQGAGGTWTQQARIAPPSGVAAGARFGYSIALAGDRLVVGAPLSGAGRVFVFTRSGTTWSQEAELVAPSIASGEQFGVAVATDGNSAIIGARYEDDGTLAGGSAHVFVRSGTTWAHQQRLHASDQNAGDDFGTAVAIDGSTALVGAIFHTAPSFAGAAWVFTRSGTTWSQQAKLVASDAAALDQFSRSLALDGDVAVIGAPQNQVTAFNDGAAYVFTRSGTAWSQTARLGAASPGDQLGYSVTIDGDVLAAGARFASNRGAVVLFERTGGVWAQSATRTAPDGAAGDRFGDSVALSSGTLAIGAPFTDGGGANAGSAYLVSVRLSRLQGAPCGADAECASGFCVDGVCCESACAGGATDCQACSVTAGGGLDGTCTALRSAVAPTITCRAAAGTCDAPEVCSAASRACPADARVAAGTQCRASAGACDVREVCDGTSAACPADARATAGMECRASTGACDVAEVCNGTATACPADARVAAGTECRASMGDCDVAEECDGTSVSCPADARVTAGTECRASAGDCDVAESCDGAGVSCPADARVAAGTECRASAGDCDVAESCDGASATCPGDLHASDGTSCADGAVCNGDELCAGGACGAGTALDCDDGDVCTADSCAEPAGCGHTPIAGCCVDAADCDDGDPCTTDRCESSSCAHDPIAGCGDAGVDPDAGVGDAGVVDADASIELDAGIEVDGGVELDAGIIDDGAVDEDGGTTERDGSTGADAGATADAGGSPPEEDGGCSCRAAGAGSDARGGWALAIAALAMGWARRRRARRA